MVKVTIYRDEMNNIVRYIVKGHAGYAEYGQDIVCSAISILAQNTLMSLIEVCGLTEEEITYDIDDGYLEIKLSEDIEYKKFDDCQIVLKTFELGVKSIYESYSEYLTLIYRRCNNV